MFWLAVRIEGIGAIQIDGKFDLATHHYMAKLLLLVLFCVSINAYPQIIETDYFSNGRQKRTLTFADTCQCYVESIYHENGRLNSRVHFIQKSNGALVKNGVETLYSVDSTFVMVSSWKNDVPDGMWYAKHTDGKYLSKGI